MKHSLEVGLNFGLTSGIITTLGVIVGLNSGTHSKLVVLGGIFTIAIADSMSDALGIHMSEESENVHSLKEIWQSTISTFLSKFLCALSFVIPVLLLDLMQAIMVSIVWGFLLIILLSYRMARKQHKKPYSIIGEHLLIATLVVILTHYVGELIAKVFA